MILAKSLLRWLPLVTDAELFEDAIRLDWELCDSLLVLLDLALDVFRELLAPMLDALADLCDDSPEAARLSPRKLPACREPLMCSC